MHTSRSRPEAHGSLYACMYIIGHPYHIEDEFRKVHRNRLFQNYTDLGMYFVLVTGYSVSFIPFLQ